MVLLSRDALADDQLFFFQILDGFMHAADLGNFGTNELPLIAAS